MEYKYFIANYRTRITVRKFAMDDCSEYNYYNAIYHTCVLLRMSGCAEHC